jgi:hypothetical protein
MIASENENLRNMIGGPSLGGSENRPIVVDATGKSA